MGFLYVMLSMFFFFISIGLIYSGFQWWVSESKPLLCVLSLFLSYVWILAFILFLYLAIREIYNGG